MTKIKTALHVFIKSISSPKYVNDIIKTELNFSMKYFALLATFASLVALSGIAKPIMVDFKEGIKETEVALIKEYPEGLVVTLLDGEASINQPEPFFIKGSEGMLDEPSEESGEVFENLIVFDSNGTLDDLNNYKTLILVNKTNILTRGSNKIEVYPLTDIPNGEFDIEDVKTFIDSSQPLLKTLPYIVLFFAFVGLVVYYFIFKAIFLLVVALPLSLVGLSRGFKLKYSKYYQIAIHALTLPLMVEIITDILNYKIPINSWFFWLTIFIGVISLFNIGKNSVEANK